MSFTNSGGTAEAVRLLSRRLAGAKAFFDFADVRTVFIPDLKNKAAALCLFGQNRIAEKGCFK